MIAARWYWFVLSAIVCIILARIVISTIEPTYQQNSMVVIKEDDKKGDSNGSSQAFLELSGLSSTNEIENEPYVIRSTPLVQEVVENLHLYVNYRKWKTLRYEELFNETPATVDFVGKYYKDVSFAIHPLSASMCKIYKFEISDPLTGVSKIEYEKTVPYFVPINTPAGRVIIKPTGKVPIDKFNYDLYISRHDVSKTADAFKNELSTSLEKNTSLITITCEDKNLGRAQAILKSLVDMYNKYTIEDKNKVAENTAKFIDNRLKMVSQELGAVDSKLANIKSRSKIIDFEDGAQEYLTESSAAKRQNSRLRIISDSI
jgi:uncharacterized protein involved in exopolysaccharide biosynthesis